MDNNKLKESIKDIVATLAKHSNETVTGAYLGSSLIPEAAPELNIREVVKKPSGPGALSQFITLYLSDSLIPNGRSGSDIRYKVITDGSCKSKKPECTNSALWKTFASPSGDFQLVLDIETNTLKVIQGELSNESGEYYRIDRVSKEELDEIRDLFLDELDELGGVKRELAETLRKIKDYPEWARVIRENSNKYFLRWSKFRRESIKELFRTRLSDFVSDSVIVDKLVIELEKSQKKLNSLKTEKGKSSISSLDASKFNEKRFRSVLSGLIKELPLDDLSEIKLPYGIVYDAVMKSKN